MVEQLHRGLCNGEHPHTLRCFFPPSQSFSKGYIKGVSDVVVTLFVSWSYCTALVSIISDHLRIRIKEEEGTGRQGDWPGDLNHPCQTMLVVLTNMMAQMVRGGIGGNLDTDSYSKDVLSSAENGQVT